MNMNTATILPWISFFLGIAVAVLQIYVTGKLAKIKEDILTIVRIEFKEEIRELEKKMVTKEILTLTERNIELMITNVSRKIDEKVR